MSDSTNLEKLMERRESLRARLDAIKKDYQSGLSADFSEQAVELENSEVLDEIARTTAEELARVEDAITAIRSGP